MACLAFVIVLAFMATSPCIAEILDFPLQNDSRGLIPVNRFGFTNHGHMELEASHISLSNVDDSINPALIGFLLLTDDQLTLTAMQLRKDPGPDCLLDTFFASAILTFKDLNGSDTYRANFSASNANQYTLVFVNCQSQVEVSMDISVSFYNIKGKDGTKDYLSDGLTQLPVLFFSFSAVHFVLFASWIYLCVKQRKAAHSIHVLMGILVFFKAMYLFSEGGDQAYVKHKGVVHGWEIVMYIFGFLKGVMLFTVIILVGAGWSILKPHLQGSEKWILMIVIPLQVLANIAEVFIGEKGPFFQDWLAWDRLMFLIDVICCCAVLLPIIWSIKRLRHAAQTDGKAATNLVKLTLFRQYYMVVVCYIYFTRVVVVVIANVMSYRYAWVSILASELATLSFYVFTGYKFQPTPFNPYFMLGDEDEEVMMTEFKDDEFEL